MKPNIIQAVKAIRTILLANENKPTTLQEVFNLNTGDIPMAEIHYAARVMCQNKDLSRVKQGTYVLTDSTKPVEAYISHTRKRKARKPRKVNPAVSLEKQLDKWDAEEKKTDWRDLCQKLQHALAASYVAEEQLEDQIKALKSEITRRDTIIAYLESRNTL